mgnify:CR=1 FL=1
MLEKYNDVLSIKDLKEILPICSKGIYNLLNTNKIKNIKVGTKIIIPKDSLIEYLKSAS